MYRDCPVCGDLMEGDRVICEACECDYEGSTTIEKRRKDHVVDGYLWWRIKRDAPKNYKSYKVG